jgi:hypothetical protein
MRLYLEPKTAKRVSNFKMLNAAQAWLSWKPDFRFRAELFQVLILLVLIITGVAVTPGASG